MVKKLYTINTVNNFMDIIFNPFGKPFAVFGKIEIEQKGAKM